MKHCDISGISLYMPFAFSHIPHWKRQKKGHALSYLEFSQNGCLHRMHADESKIYFLFSPEDTGARVTAAFLDPNTWVGKDMRIVTEWLNTREMTEIALR